MKRKHIGGASAPVMKKIVEERKKIFISYSNWIESTWVKINSAKEKTDETINNI